MQQKEWNIQAKIWNSDIEEDAGFEFSKQRRFYPAQLSRNFLDFYVARIYFSFNDEKTN